MKYSRTMVLQSCHFNGSGVYKSFDVALRAAEDGEHRLAYNKLRGEVLPNIHGHNFVVTVDIDTYIPLQEPAGGKHNVTPDYCVDDKRIVEVLETFNNTNLSVHPWFVEANIRATTERLAEAVLAAISVTVMSRTDDELSIKVKVWENKDISAEVEVKI